MEFIDIIMYISNLLYFVQGLLIFRILSYFAKKRDGKIWNVVIYLSCAILSSMIIYPNDLTNVIIDLIWFTALMLTAFYGSVWQRLAAVAVLYPLILSQNFFVMDFFGVFGNWLGWSLALDIFCTVADPVSHLLIWYGIYRLFENNLDQTRQLFGDKIWILLDAVCLASLVSITTCILLAPKETYKMWPAVFACFATNLGCIALAKYFITSIRQNMERKNLILQKSYYEKLEQNQAEIRRFRHDMNNHLSTVRSLFDSGNLKDAGDYLRELETQMTVHTRVFCKNSIVNAVLNAKYNLAQEHGIDSFFHIDLDRLAGMDSVSLCSLFSNTLDNAIEASLRIPDPKERRMSVKARVTENGYFTCEVTNAKKNRILLDEKGQIQSDKGDLTIHGFGLSNVREIVEKYDGTMDISYTEDIFTVTILIENV
jgi:two-component system sensor histidine kinase AgrC